MKFLRYAGPYDGFDANQLFGKQPEEVVKYVFFGTNHQLVPDDWRGNINEVTDAEAEELLSYPGHRFVEVAPEHAGPHIKRQLAARANREGLEKLRQAHELPSPPLTGTEPPPAPVPAPDQPQVALMAPRSVEDIKADVAAEKKALAALEKQAKAAKE